MHIKSAIKVALGERNFERIKWLRQNVYYIKDYLCHNIQKIDAKTEFKIYEEKDSNVFFGYYDIPQINNYGDKLLVHILPRNAQVGKDRAIIGYIDRTSGKICEIASTLAWSWQQGSRLRWNPVTENQLMFNSFDGNDYCLEVWDILSHRKIHEYPYPMYDIDNTFTYGLTLNFSRLQRLRPGYGYCNCPDETITAKAPQEDGIFKYMFTNNCYSQLISTYELAKYKHVDKKYNNYLNHISIAPDGEHFIFFHIWTEKEYLGRRTALYVMDKDGSNIVCLEDEEIVSHYAWRNEEEVLITTTCGKYRIYNILNKKKQDIKLIGKTLDGHPGFLCENLIISDTYPQHRSQQELFTFDILEGKRNIIANIFSDPRLYGEKRCDLHPRIDSQRGIITVDSTLNTDKRCVLEFNVDQLLVGKNDTAY